MLFLSQVRREALLALEKGEAVSAVAIRLGVSNSSVRKWRRAAEHAGLTASTTTPYTLPEAQEVYH